MSTDISVEVKRVRVEFNVHFDGKITPTSRRFSLRRRHTRPVVALDDISFEIPRGSAVGLIGANGAGKSTLLRVLAGTLAPNRGEVVMDGRVSAILQLGAGFHPQLSGRKNIFLAALALGFSKREVGERFDSIARYAGLGDALDRSVKTYSSGMRSRLAFAVAVHVDPDILLVDEVLSVGDEQFRQKSRGTMEELVGGSGTLFYATHSLTKLPDLCTSTLWLERGRVREFGPTSEVIRNYRRAFGIGRLAASVPAGSRAAG